MLKKQGLKLNERRRRSEMIKIDRSIIYGKVYRWGLTLVHCLVEVKMVQEKNICLVDA